MSIFLAPNRGLGARRGLLERVHFFDPKIGQKNCRQRIARKRYYVAIYMSGMECVNYIKEDVRPFHFLK